MGQDAGLPGMGPAPSLVHEPGASVLAQKILHPGFRIFEREFRVLPDEGWFSPLLTPRRPVEFQLGAFIVPASTSLWLTDYQFQVYRPSGVDPGDFVPAESGRFSNQLGFDITVGGGRRPGNLSYQLDPEPVLQGRPEFEPPIGVRGRPADAFNNAAARSFASTASPATSLLPARPNVQGPRGGPFTFVVDEGTAVALNVVIFNTIRSPIAAIGGRVAGWLLSTTMSAALLSRVRPQ
jgi:hypothetical protein